MHSIGIAFNKEAEKVLLIWKPISDCIITAHFQSWHMKTTIMQVYTPIEDDEEAEKDVFFGQIQDNINEISNHDGKLLISDMNAQVDNNRQGMEH